MPTPGGVLAFLPHEPTSQRAESGDVRLDHHIDMHTHMHRVLATPRCVMK